jgi:DNA (cytosine-5)-methyltransferase 1
VSVKREPDITAVDLFSGAGGLSLGFRRAGAKTVLAVEAERRAAATFGANHPGAVVLQERITNDWSVVDRLKECSGRADPTLLIGGPPCQGWSSLGGRGSDERRDALNACVDTFIDQAKLLRPLAVVMENVHGLAVRQKGRHLDHVERRLRRLGYSVKTVDVRAGDYGAPQLRRRIFVIATLSELGIMYELPDRIARQATVRDAIGDLPRLQAGCSADEYASPPETTLQRRLRGGCSRLTWHEAPNHSENIMRVLHSLSGEGASRTALVGKAMPTSGFHNTYARLRYDEPAPAVTSSAGRVSSGRNAHPVDDRALTPREAARLQTFPDSYHWVGERWPVYSQIGNAVPPILAEAIATPLLRALRKHIADPP